MAPQFNFSLPENMNANVQIALAPPVSISGWTIQFDLMYRFGSQQPIVSKYLASGYTTGQSGMTLIDGTAGVFQVAFNQAEVSGVSQTTNTLAFRTYRTNSGSVTDLNGGYRLLAPF